jgi:hypothetical protein
LHELQKRICIAYVLGEILCRCQPCLFGLMCVVALKFLYLSFVWWPICWWQWVFRSPTITVLVSICFLRVIRDLLMQMCAPVFGACMLRIDISFWRIISFINMKCHSSSLLINFSLKSTLSDMNIATPACLWGPFSWKTFFYPFTLSQCLFFQLDESLVSNIWLGLVF